MVSCRNFRSVQLHFRLLLSAGRQECDKWIFQIRSKWNGCARHQVNCVRAIGHNSLTGPSLAGLVCSAVSLRTH